MSRVPTGTSCPASLTNSCWRRSMVLRTLETKFSLQTLRAYLFDVSRVNAILLLQISIQFLRTCKSPSSWEVRFLAPPFSNLKPWTFWKGGCFFKILYHHILLKTKKISIKKRKGVSIGGPRPWLREHSSASPLSSSPPAARPPEKPGWVNTKS